MIFFIILIILVTIISLLIFFTEIRIHIIDLKLKSERTSIKLDKDFKIIFELHFFSRINYLKISIDKNKLKTFKSSENIDKIKQQMAKYKKKIKFKNIYKNLKLKVKKISLKLEIGTEDAALTAICTGVISTFLSMFVENLAYSIKEINWKVDPVYNYGNLLNLEFNCIFSLKLIHIINTIYEMRKEGDKYARTSNRKDFEHVYE